MLFKLKNAKYWPFYPKMLIRLVLAQWKLWKVNKMPPGEARMDYAQRVAHYLEFSSCVYFSSSILEEVFLEEAKKIPEVVCSPKKGTCLHVVAQLGGEGGLTRVVERWIDHTHAIESASVVILDQPQNREVPQWFVDTVEKYQGKIYRLSEQSYITRAKVLREIAANYEKIVLHVYNSDPTHILAFGVESFTNPIIFFNHSDHKFWLGVSVADIVADISYNDYTEKRRKSMKSFFLGIPPEANQKVPKLEKCVVRKELGIADDQFVVISCGRAIKYQPINRDRFSDLLVRLVKNNEKLTCFVIGPSLQSDGWKYVEGISNAKVQPLGPIHDKNLYYKYLTAADLYVGSFPSLSYTAMMDGIMCGLPLLQLRMSMQYQVGIDTTNGRAECWTKSLIELEKKIKRTISDVQYRNRVYEDSLELLNSYSNVREWEKRLHKLYTMCPPKHRVYHFSNELGRDVYIDDFITRVALMNGIHYHFKIIQKIATYFIRF